MHERWQDQLPFYVAGTLSPVEQAVLEQHLASCESCRVLVEMWRNVATTIRAEVEARNSTPSHLHFSLNGHERNSTMLLATSALRRRPLPSISAVLIAAVVLITTAVFALAMLSRSETLHTSPNQQAIVSLIPTTPSPTPEPQPTSIRLEGIRYEQQGWNNQGPTALSMALSYYGWQGDQADIQAQVRPNTEDKNSSPWELVRYVNEQTTYKALYRIGGTTDLLERLVSTGFPVIIETGFQPAGDEWMGHYRLIMGYDQGQFAYYDSYMGSNDGDGILVPYSEFDTWWQDFNRLFMVVYRMEDAAHLREVLGDYVNPAYGYDRALEIALKEIDTNQDDQWAWFNLGTAYVYQGDYESAVAAYDQSFRMNMPWRTLWYQFGPYEAYYEVGRYEDIAALASGVLANTANVEETYYWQGMVYLAEGDIEAALEQFKLALRYNQNFTPAETIMQEIAGY
jgi:tetratricopeptide (TPR) repeat protein